MQLYSDHVTIGHCDITFDIFDIILMFTDITILCYDNLLTLLPAF
jgi:hypothetical protein